MRILVCKPDEVFQGPLILVNREHPLCGTDCLTLIPVDAGRTVLLERRAALLLQACIRDVGGNREIVPVSGWRSQEDQIEIWEQTMAEHGEAFTRKYVALPGCSEHQSGLAIDLGRAAPYIDLIRPAFPYDGVCGAFRRAAARYGFVERYARGKEDVTGIAYEPWHFRYVGAPHAQILLDNNLCLEEYVDFLRAGPRTCLLPGRRMAQVFYVPCHGKETLIEVPEGCCQVSGDNRSGFIVTAWGRVA